MKHVFFLCLSLVSSWSFASSHFIPINQTGTYKCSSNEVVAGVRYDDRGNKSISGIWCEKLSAQGNNSEQFFNVNDGGNGTYDVKCDTDDFVAGFNYGDDFDPSVEGMYCKNVRGHTGSSYYRKVEGLRGKRYDVMCDRGSYVSGINYRESLDDTLIGIHCTEFWRW